MFNSLSLIPKGIPAHLLIIGVNKSVGYISVNCKSGLCFLNLSNAFGNITKGRFAGSGEFPGYGVVHETYKKNPLEIFRNEIKALIAELPIDAATNWMYGAAGKPQASADKSRAVTLPGVGFKSSKH